MAFERTPTVSVSVSVRRSDGNYGYVEAFAAVSQLGLDTDQGEIDALLALSGIAFNKVQAKVTEQLTKRLGGGQ
jgi:hypothetical protein